MTNEFGFCEGYYIFFIGMLGPIRWGSVGWHTIKERLVRQYRLLFEKGNVLRELQQSITEGTQSQQPRVGQC